MRRGFTLIELLVYMAIMGFIIVVAGRVFSDATGMRVRSQSMLKASEQVGQIANLITEDISQMGVKVWGQSSSSGLSVSVPVPDVYISPPGTAFASFDSSSFELHRLDSLASSSCGGKIISAKTAFDSIVFRKAAFNANGNALLGVREISWAVNDDCELRRWCKTMGSCVAGDADCSGTGAECPSGTAKGVLVAKNVRKFSLYASAPGTQPNSGSNLNNLTLNVKFPAGTPSFNLIPETDNAMAVWPTHVNNNTEAIISGSYAQNNPSSASSADKYNELYLVPVGGNIAHCISVPIQKGETWVVEFNMPFPSGSTRADSSSTQFLPGKDHVAVGLRSKSYHKVPGISQDILLYPSQDEHASGHVRYAEFFANESPAQEPCVAITLSFYSPLARRGRYSFSNFKIYRKPTGAYHFVKEGNGYSTNFAKEYATESDLNKLMHKKNVKAFELMLEINQNGEVAGTYSKGAAAGANTGIAIPVPNNGGVL